MGGFFSQRDRSGVERWWLEVTGKGDKTRMVPVLPQVREATDAYLSLQSDFNAATEQLNAAFAAVSASIDAVNR